MTTAEYRRWLYADRKERRACVDCEAGLGDDPRVRCVECRDRMARSDRARSEAGKRRSGGSPAALLERNASKRRRREERKVSGKCVQDYCSALPLEDSLYCARHRAMHIEANRRYERRKRSKNPPPEVTTCLLPSSTERARV